MKIKTMDVKKKSDKSVREAVCATRIGQQNGTISGGGEKGVVFRCYLGQGSSSDDLKG